VGSGRGAIHVVGMKEKRRELAIRRAEEVVVEGAAAAAEVRTGRER
jgi:hypothetical protein